MRCVPRLQVILLLVGSSAALGCTGRGRAARAQTSAAVEVRRMSFLPTSQLIADPALAALVEQLAPASRIESAHIGYAGSPSEVHALFTRISKAATAQQLVALLRHDSAVVRGYAAEHVVANFPTELAAVYPLLADSTKVEAMSGCRCALSPPTGARISPSMRRSINVRMHSASTSSDSCESASSTV